MGSQALPVRGPILIQPPVSLARSGLSDYRCRHARDTTPSLVLTSYLALLFAPQLLPVQLGFNGFMAIVLTWFAASNWSAWKFSTAALAAAVTGISIIGLVSAPVNAIFIGCYVFKQCP